MTQQRTAVPAELATILPRTAEISEQGHLLIGRCDTIDLVRQFGTPLWVFDERELRETCREYLREFRSRYPNTEVVYASKAYFGKAIARLVAEEGLSMDIVSGGELAVALAAGFPAERLYFHGNNKSEDELREAVRAGVGRIVVDANFELEALNKIALQEGRRQPILLRITPGIDPHTHEHLTTGAVDSKFGFTLVGGVAEAAVRRALELTGVELLGIHCHLGSQIFELDPYQQAPDIMLGFAAQMRDRYGWTLSEFSPGGGFAVQYVREAPRPPYSVYAETLDRETRAACAKYGLPEPKISIEPGRSTVARAGVAFYTVGGRKEIPGVRTYVSVDGGMSDNMRPVTYGAKYEAIVANRAAEPPVETVSISGKYCEQGDILIHDIALPRIETGDVIAIPTSGAYCLPMASNYNGALKVPIVYVMDGKARLVRRRETYEDLLRTELE
jgi:diaminopimelate decarboxylase